MNKNYILHMHAGLIYVQRAYFIRLRLYTSLN